MCDVLAPQHGDAFIVPGMREPRTVARLLLAISADDGPTRYLVESEHGARWTLTRRRDGWLGVPLPADPIAARDWLTWVDTEL
jgi:hypothetical protein